jgi:hypothetical protein
MDAVVLYVQHSGLLQMWAVAFDKEKSEDPAVSAL